MVSIWESANWPLAQRASGLKIKDLHTQNVLTYRFFLNLPRRKVMIYFRQKGKKKGVTVLVFEIMRCILRRLRHFKTILAYTCQQ